MATSLLGLGLLLAGGLTARAQQAAPAEPSQKRTLFYGRSALPPAPVSSAPAPLPSNPPASTPVPPASLPANWNSTLPALPQAAPAPARLTPGLSPASFAPVRPVRPALQQTALQSGPGAGLEPGIATGGYEVEFEPPGPETLFKIRSDAAFRETMRQQARSQQLRSTLEFPTDPVLAGSGSPYARNWVWPQCPDGRPLQNLVEPNYVCYGRTYFDQPNFERHGWNLGAVQPLLNATKFYWDVVVLPYHMGTEPCRHYECNAGQCLPGDPTPFYLYPPQFSLTGLAAEAAAITGVVLVFP